jgi:hypothetical protein
MDASRAALGAEVRALVAASRVTNKQVQKATGISATAWNNYFVQGIRDVPIGVVALVADFFGMTASELLRRAEDRMNGPSLPDYLLRQVSPEKMAAARRQHEELLERKRRAQPNG